MPDNYQIALPFDYEQAYTPHKVGPSSYKVVRLSESLSQEIGVQVGKEVYYINSGLALKVDKHSKFTLRFDKTRKELQIENLVESVWSEEEESLSENRNK